MCFLAVFIRLTPQINNLDRYESCRWAEDFRETALDFALLNIHKPNIQHTDLPGTIAHGTNHHKKSKYSTKKSSHHKPAWVVRGKEMCIKDAKRRYTVLKS